MPDQQRGAPAAANVSGTTPVARGKGRSSRPGPRQDTCFEVERSDDAYERTRRRLLEDAQIRGIAARLNGKMVGAAHYLFHASVWYSGRCYLADLFVDEEVRRQGIATAMTKWVAQDAKAQGFPSRYWNTLEDAPARALYDRVGKLRKGFILYGYRRDATQRSA
ncbi:hypothetical protein GCM10022222_47100 [Amycolatopsis ultiminotia]|uniref:N-acetyltransferase domain-containing protein n=1 Tax=Amycolatopsis ultiminotia TaxID=543629 RepID=A0ABP6WX82_9PSEU